MPSPPEDPLVVRHADEPPTDPPEPRRARWSRFARDLGGSLVLVAGLWLAIGWARAPDLPSVAPAFSLSDLDGRTVSLADLRGKTVVLNFWATWCGPCRMEAPTLTAFAKSHPDVPVLGIAVDGTAAALKQAAQSLGIEYPVLIADKATLAAYKVGTLPTTVIVAGDGTIRSAHTGLMLGPHLRWLAR